MSSTHVFVIAEAGVNHNGDVERALAMIDAAADAKADAIKFQTFEASKLVTSRASKAAYQARATGDADNSQLGMLRKLELPASAYPQLAERCRARGIELMSTPFDEESVGLLVRHGVRRMKIGSGDVTNAPLLLEVARSGLPVILSTGMSTLGEIERALGVLAFGRIAPAGKLPSRSDFDAAYASTEGQRALREGVTLLHCVSEYPAPARDVNLRAIDTMQTAFGLPVGYSDHTMGVAVSIAAVARGAIVIEKHFTLDRGLPGPDHTASLEPSDLSAMVAGIRDVSVALGSSMKSPAASEIPNREIVRRSIVAARPIRKGEAFTPVNTTVKRPAGGRSPFEYWDLMGVVAERDYDTDDWV